MRRHHRVADLQAQLLYPGASARFDGEARPPAAPKVTVESISVGGIQGADAMVTLSLRVENPNAIELMIQSLRFGLSINDVALTSGATVRVETIPAGGSALIELETRTNITAVLQVIALPASGRMSSLQYVLDGEAVVQNGVRLPFARRGDIPLLANHALAKFGHLAEGRVKEIGREAMEVVLDYSWPGNVRQLESAIERAILLCEGEKVMPRDLPEEVLSRKTPGRSGERQRGDKYEIPSEGFNFETFERDAILQALERNDWVIAKAAKMLAMSYRTLQYRIDKFGLKRGEQPRPIPPDIKG